MNKKQLITILTLVVVLTAVLAMVLVGCGKKEPQAEAVEPTASQTQTEAPEVPGNTEETEEPTRETIPGEPDPYGESDEVTQKPAEETEPSEPATEPEEKDEPTTPGTSQQPTTGDSTGSTNIPTAGGSAYESYIAMSGEQQQAFIDQFASVAEFVNWYNAAKAEYDAAHPDIEIGGDTVIDGSQLGKN